MKTGSNHLQENPAPNHSGPRRAKIICTIGPACSTESAMRDLLRCGMDIARLNFSHGTHEDLADNIQRLRRIAQREGRTVCILEDLQGPKIRTGLLEERRPVFLKSASVVTITPDETPGNETRISTTFPDLAREITPGARILLSDGLIEVRVRTICGQDVLCEVIHGGRLGEQKGINLPGVALSIPALTLTAKDRQDLEFGLKHSVDAVALSFVRSAADVTEVKQIIASHGSAPMYAFTHVEPVVQRLNLYWGVHPVRCLQASSAEQMVSIGRAGSGSPRRAETQ